MAKTKRLKVRRAVDIQDQEWELRHDNKAVWHKIEVLGPVENWLDTDFVAVHIKQRIELADPDHDVALLVGKIMRRLRSGTPDPNRPELWFYDDRFWTKATDDGGMPYYRNKTYVFHPVNVRDEEGLFAAVKVPGQDEEEENAVSD
jgi:hypothetical protein